MLEQNIHASYMCIIPYTMNYIELLDYVYIYIYITNDTYLYRMHMYSIKNKVIENPIALLPSNFNSFQAWQRFGSPQRHCGQRLARSSNFPKLEKLMFPHQNNSGNVRVILY